MRYSYESSEMFLSIVQMEYQNEKDRAAALDSKIALSLPVISAYFFLLAQDANVRKLWTFFSESGYSVEDMRLFLALLLYVISIFSAFLSLFWMIRATWTHNFQAIGIMQSNNAKIISMPRELFSARIATDYLRKVEWYWKANMGRANKYRTGWIFGLVSLSCFLLYAIITQWL